MYRAVTMIDHRPVGPVLAESENVKDVEPYWVAGKVGITWSCDVPIKKWTKEAVAKGRKTRLRNKLLKKHPLLADQLYETELKQRPSFYDGN